MIRIEVEYIQKRDTTWDSRATAKINRDQTEQYPCLADSAKSLNAAIGVTEVLLSEEFRGSRYLIVKEIINYDSTSMPQLRQ